MYCSKLFWDEDAPHEDEKKKMFYLQSHERTRNSDTISPKQLRMWLFDGERFRRPTSDLKGLVT